MEWQKFVTAAHHYYRKAAQFFLLQNLLIYLWACFTAQHPVGLSSYIAFLNYCCRWRG